ncbi:MAG: hypothetical protein ACOVLB_09110 [Candidatus Nanopelagicus sp.]
MKIDPLLWYGTRELSVVPPHFIKCPTTVNPDSKYWIQNNASGRYVFAKLPTNHQSQYIIEAADFSVYFENNQDAVMYELFWSGS